MNLSKNDVETIMHSQGEEWIMGLKVKCTKMVKLPVKNKGEKSLGFRGRQGILRLDTKMKTYKN